MPRSEEFVSKEIFSTVKLVVADRLLGATSIEFQCAFALPKPVLLIIDSAALESMCSRIGTTLPRSLAKRLNSHRLCCCTVASVQFCFGCAGGCSALLLRPGLDQVFPVQDHASADRLP